MLDELLNNKDNNKKQIEEVPSSDEIKEDDAIHALIVNEEIAPLETIKEEKEEPKQEQTNNSNDDVVEGSRGILYLINGLGIASKGSFNIDYNDIMPNMSMLMGNYLYTSLQNLNYNYKSGFRTFSLGNDLLPTYHQLESDTNLGANKTIISIANDVINNHTKLHLFCFLDNEEVIKQVLKIINVLTPMGNFNIFIHIVLRQRDVKEYEDIISKIKLIDDAITLLPNVRIGLISGERNVNSDAYYTLITKENGEKWPDYSRKLRFLEEQNIKPLDCEPFYMHPGFILQRNDVSLFLNYEEVDCDLLIKRMSYVKLYTLFPMKEYSYAINMYDELEPPVYFSKTLEANNLKCLVLTTKDRIASINYNLCGLEDKKSPNIEYLDITEKKDIRQYINYYNYIIYDYDLTKFKEIRKLKEFLMELDEEINDIYTLCEEKDYKLFISSLYGMYQTFIAGVDKEVLIDYSLEVPAILIDKDLPRSKFMFKYGNTFRLSNTIFNLITNNENIETAIRKRSIMAYFKD